MMGEYFNNNDDCGCNSNSDWREDRDDCSRNDNDRKPSNRLNNVEFKCKEIRKTFINYGKKEIASITVPKLSHFKRPCIKLDIAPVITITDFEYGDEKAEIIVKVFRHCRGWDKEEVRSFKVNITIDDADVKIITLPSLFSLCDCDLDCCEKECFKYTVEVEAEQGDIEIQGGTISIIASDEC